MIGARAVNAEPTVQKYLGFAPFFRKVGISIGLSVIVMQQLPMYSLKLTTIIMASVLFYETLGPVFAKNFHSKCERNVSSITYGIRKLSNPLDSPIKA